MKISNKTYDIIKSIKNKLGFCKLALIDPDLKNDLKLNKILMKINSSDFHAILIGGSNIIDDKYEERIKYIKDNTDLPLIVFPGSSIQITKQIDTILYLNLISGRNPKFLIEEQVKGSLDIYNYNITPIPTAYILLDGKNPSSVFKYSNTKPLSMGNKDKILKHALAGQYLGNELIYFDNGSGAKNKIDIKLLEYLKKYISIPIVIGGGLETNKDIEEVIDAGASYVVLGTYFEKYN
tara:strand:+ start:20 stop:730 length:711 start_codon:yes stop_codon:yes gene_type:complete